MHNSGVAILPSIAPRIILSNVYFHFQDWKALTVGYLIASSVELLVLFVDVTICLLLFVILSLLVSIILLILSLLMLLLLPIILVLIEADLILMYCCVCFVCTLAPAFSCSYPCHFCTYFCWCRCLCNHCCFPCSFSIYIIILPKNRASYNIIL